MVTRPIIFSAPMVRALLAWRKTQTRRILNLPTKGIYERPDMGGWAPTTVGGHGCYYSDGRPAPEMEGMWLTPEDIAANEALEKRVLLPHIAAINGGKKYPLTCRGKFVSLWVGLHGGLDAWDDNPWVVAVTFSVIKANIDSALAPICEEVRAG